METKEPQRGRATSNPPLVVAGLQNPGSRYAGTRHNVGAEVVDLLARRWDVKIKRGPLRVRADLARYSTAQRSVVLAIPRSFMNESGPALNTVLRYFKTESDDLIVLHDDIDLPFGRLRLHHGRGEGGHNGVRSVVGTLGTRDFHRLKIGVGRPPGRQDPADFVLMPFGKRERVEVDLLVEDAADVVERFLDSPEQAVELAGRRRGPDG